MALDDLYDPQIAYNPDTEQLVTGAVFQVFAPDDASFTTPLTLTDPASGTGIATLRSSNIGVLPAFKVAGNLPRVIIRSGSFTTLLSSRFGELIDAGFDPAAVAAAAAAVTGAEAAKGEAELARDQALDAKADVEAVVATNDGIMKTVAEDPESEFSRVLSDTIDSVLNGSGGTPSSEGFLRLAGTVPGAVPVVKPTGDSRAGVWEMTHNSATGYLFHLLSGANMSHTAALLGLGVDNDGIGIMIPNKKLGRGIVGDQRSTVTAADGYWLHVTQRSAAAPAVRLEMNANDAADVMQLIAFGSPGAGQRLLYVSDPNGEAGRIIASNGQMLWQRNIRIRNQASGEVVSYLELSTSSASSASTTRKNWIANNGETTFSPTGSAGVYYPYRSTRSGNIWVFQVAPTITAASPTNPNPTDDSPTWSTLLGMRYEGGAAKLGFFGATPVAKPTGVAVTAEAIHAALVSLGLIGA